MKNTFDVSEKRIKKSLVLQQDQNDCGVACLLSVMKYYKGNHSLEALRELSGTSTQGTSLLGLFQAANQIGFTAKGCESDMQSLVDHKEPVILHVLIQNRLQHYVVCYGFLGNQFLIGDPAKGIYSCSKNELNDIWKSKTCLVLTPNDSFVQEKTVKKAKKEWFLQLLKKDYQLLSFSVVLGLCIAVLGMAMAVFSQKLIDDILPSKDFNKLITGITLVTFLLVIRVVFEVLRSYFLIQQSKDFNNRIIDSFYAALLHLPKPFFDTRKIGELVSRLNDTQRIQEVIRQVANTFVVNLLISVVSLSFLFYYSWHAGSIALVSLPFYFVLIYRFNNRIIKAQKEVMQSRAYSQSNYIATMDGIAAIKNNNKQPLFKRINKSIYANYQNKVFDLGKIDIRLSLFSGIFSVLFLTILLAFVSFQVYYEILKLGELMAIIGIAGSLLPSVASLALITIPINEAKIAFNRMFDFAAMETEKQGNINLETFKSLSVQNLGFRFAGRSRVLKDVSLQVDKGECVAVVGESGCGKSTLGQIIQKFYEPESGEVIINGKHALQDISMLSWREHIGVIEQDIKIFNHTVLGNISMSDDDQPESVVNFCKKYGLDKYISQFPQGYATILGESGINLSGGQKQIIALARALYKKPKLLVLDEYTSAMDRKTEQFSLQLLQKLKKDIGIIFISHRLHSLPKIADRVYVIENGITTVSGTHFELMKTSNFYSDFWKDQVVNYRGLLVS